MPQLPLVAFVGPTGVGKTEFSLEYVKALQKRGYSAEIINADAMQLYRGMDIGTAKLPHDQRQDIPHHLFDVCEVTAEISVRWYQEEARNTILQVQERTSVPVLVGGSGLYVSSVLFDFDFPKTDPVVRSRLEQDLAEYGSGYLFQRLKTLDPESAQRIGSANVRRVIRALEVAVLTGEPVQGVLPNQQKTWIPSVVVGLWRERSDLVEALDRRVVTMWENGFVEEVQMLLSRSITSGVTASQAIGYAQVLAYLRSEISQQEAVERTQQLTRRYARRQMSWFRRYGNIHWINTCDSDRVERACELFDIQIAEGA